MDGSWRMTADYHKLTNGDFNCTLCARYSFHNLKLIHPLVPGMQLLIWQMLFSPSLLIKTTRSSLLSAEKASNTPSLSCLRVISTLQPHARVLANRDIDHPSFPWVIILVHYIDDIILIGPSDQEVGMTRHIDKTFMC